MFDRFILASNYKHITERFNMCYIQNSEAYKPAFNISPGDLTYVITNYQTKEIRQFYFGLQGVNGEIIPFVRAEGNRNKNDDPNYSGSKAIFLQTEFRNLIRTQRCLVLADAFIVGVHNKPHLVYLRNKNRPFAFAGIWSKSRDNNYSFAIVTTPANSLLQKLGCKRMPVILFDQYESRWLRTKSPLSDILNMLHPFPTNMMNAYPVSNKIIDKSLNNKDIIQPVGNPIFKEPNLSPFLKRRKRKENHFPKLTFADIARKSGFNPPDLN